MTTLDKDDVRQLLVKSWMTHDAMWFRHCVEECGIEQTNRINKAAVRSMAAIEIRRLTEALGFGEVRTMRALRELIEAAWELISADFMGFEVSHPAPTVIRWDVPRCFAFEGVTRLGVVDRYECGIFPRLEAWFDTLDIAYTVTPAVQGCLMQAGEACYREYAFDLPEG